jgi:predicted ester cyclase
MGRKIGTHLDVAAGQIGGALDPLAALLRGFAVDFLTGQQWAALPQIMDPEYRLNVGGFLLTGRDEQYRAAMLTQFEQFPGLCVTVHDVLLGADALAMRFTEHGASRRDGGRRAAWQGVSLFRVEAGRLRFGWAEEDYIARKRQLRTGACDPIEAPHPAPWDGRVEPADAAALAVARAWLRDAPFAADRSVHRHGAPSEPDPAPIIAVDATEIDEIVSAGDRVAFHATARGTYAGGFPDADRSLLGRPAELRAAGMLTVRAGAVLDVRIVLNRLGLQRSLRPR